MYSTDLRTVKVQASASQRYPSEVLQTKGEYTSSHADPVYKMVIFPLTMSTGLEYARPVNGQ